MTYASIIAGARGIHYFILGALLPDYNEVSAEAIPACDR